MKIENLVFKGGGVLGIAYAGAISALDEENILNNKPESVRRTILEMRRPEVILRLKKQVEESKELHEARSIFRE